MQNQRLTGPNAGVEKYDLITALAVSGLAAGGVMQTSMMRLIALITARYNWAADEVTIGQREMASLWSVDERTAKRETRRLIDAGVIEIKRPGIRGRVAAYRIRRDHIYAMTASDWTAVGPDYNQRMTNHQTPAAPTPVKTPKVVHLDFAARRGPQSDTWDKVLAALSVDQPQYFDAWFSQLSAQNPDGNDRLEIRAPTKFIANYVSTRLMSYIEPAVQAGYGKALRCSIIARV